MKKWLKRGFVLVVSLIVLFFGVVYAGWGVYGINAVLRNGICFWRPVPLDSPRLSASMRLALARAPVAVAGEFTWKTVSPGFEVADLPALVDGQVVDHLYLARIDPAHYRFVLRNGAQGDKDLDHWMRELGAALVVNASYFTTHGLPDTPFISDGVQLGPKEYDAKAGAFVASSTFTGIRNLAHEDWQTALRGADNATVSYPLLVRDGVSGVTQSSRWLANRSFVGQDRQGRILVGTTTDAFFSLYRLSQFLVAAPLDLQQALNLDGGPVACQGIALNGYQRKTYGRYELRVKGDEGRLLTIPHGTPAMPVVLAVYAK